MNSTPLPSLFRKQIIWPAVVLVVIFLALMIPESDPTVPQPLPSSTVRPFFWDQDAAWDSLGASFLRSRSLGCDNIAILAESAFRQLQERIKLLRAGHYPPSAAIFKEVEQLVFLLGPWIAVCPERLPEYRHAVSAIRDVVKEQSSHWDMNARASRETLYRLLYGGRMAVEEVMLQVPPGHAVPALSLGQDEPSQTPRGMLLDVEVHSGDILVSRGGAPTSALIARGSDFPGNFSHIALVHIDERTNQVRLIESHIERGVTISNPDDYINDTKLRVMVVRIRSDHPKVVANPMLPHTAATYALRRAGEGHIPYDFAMDIGSQEELFCSEVASEAYQHVGIDLWMGRSHITSSGVRHWLADFGVRYFETQEPSDLEYDPQVVVVAEWGDVETLRKDHTDNAVTEVMLEGAERGDRIEYSLLKLPLARIVKAYSWMVNRFGMVGPIPEGMSATSALKHEWYAERHSSLVELLSGEGEVFKGKNGYAPPYWELLKLTRQIAELNR